MTVQELIDSKKFDIVNQGSGTERTISQPFCCDLLSIAMMAAPQDCAWVTVMGNINTLAVASLTDTACVIVAEGAAVDESVIKKAEGEGITVLKTQKPIFESALAIWEMIHHAVS